MRWVFCHAVHVTVGDDAGDAGISYLLLLKASDIWQMRCSKAGPERSAVLFGACARPLPGGRPLLFLAAGCASGCADPCGSHSGSAASSANLLQPQEGLPMPGEGAEAWEGASGLSWPGCAASSGLLLLPLARFVDRGHIGSESILRLISTSWCPQVNMQRSVGMHHHAMPCQDHAPGETNRCCCACSHGSRILTFRRSVIAICASWMPLLRFTLVIVPCGHHLM